MQVHPMTRFTPRYFDIPVQAGICLKERLGLTLKKTVIFGLKGNLILIHTHCFFVFFSDHKNIHEGLVGWS